MDPEMKSVYLEMYRDLLEKDEQDMGVEMSFYTAKDPSYGENPSQLVAKFDVTNDLERSDILQVSFGFFLKRILLLNFNYQISGHTHSIN